MLLKLLFFSLNFFNSLDFSDLGDFRTIDLDILVVFWLLGLNKSIILLLKLRNNSLGQFLLVDICLQNDIVFDLVRVDGVIRTLFNHHTDCNIIKLRIIDLHQIFVGNGVQVRLISHNFLLAKNVNTLLNTISHIFRNNFKLKDFWGLITKHLCVIGKTNFKVITFLGKFYEI